MGLSETLIVQGVEGLSDEIDSWDTAFFKGVAYIIFFVLIIWFLGYFLGYQSFFGHWKRTAWIIGIWLFCELAYVIGGGHDTHNHF